MFGSSCGIRLSTAIGAAACIALSGAGTAAAQSTTTFTDFTEYTYAVPAGGIGSFANHQVTRTFDAPIVSLTLTIVGGRADDIGYVGGRLVTSIPPMCADVGTVTAPVDVSDQVTINGNTATFTLRAQENCCCVTGWGTATQGDRANARFRWDVTLGGCQSPPLTEITDPQALDFEAGNTLNTANLIAAMQTALDCLRQAVAAAGGTLTVNSAFRPPAYQAHLREVWDRWNALRNSRDPECEDLKEEVRQEFQRHGLLLTQRPAANSAHTRGEAFDARWNLPSGTDIDSLAEDCDLRRPLPARDPVHFILR